MKSKLRVAVIAALAIINSSAYGVGLGRLQVNSHLNELLDAEIQISLSEGEDLLGSTVQLASLEDFRRAGLEFGPLLSFLDFTITENSGGRPIIRIRSDQPIREPYISMLLEFNHPGGKLLREYTLLLDPPVYDPGANTIQNAGAAVQTQVVDGDQVRIPQRQQQEETQTVTETPAPPNNTPINPRAQELGRRIGDEYLVQSGDTLYAIARDVATQSGASINQVMLALFRKNPRAFFRNNINALTGGRRLSLPDRDEALATSANEADSIVAQQNRDWSRGISSPVTETAVAGSVSTNQTPSTTSSSSTTSQNSGERLSLAPVEDDGVSDGGGQALEGELSRAQEELASQELENRDLQDQVTDLQQQLETRDRELELRDTQLAQLQAQLSQLQEQVNSLSQQQNTPQPTPASPAQNNTSQDSFLSTILEHPVWLGGLAVVLVAFAGLFVWLRRRGSEDAVPSIVDELRAEPNLPVEEEESAPNHEVAEVVEEEDDVVDQLDLSDFDDEDEEPEVAEGTSTTVAASLQQPAGSDASDAFTSMDDFDDLDDLAGELDLDMDDDEAEEFEDSNDALDFDTGSIEPVSPVDEPGSVDEKSAQGPEDDDEDDGLDFDIDALDQLVAQGAEEVSEEETASTTMEDKADDDALEFKLEAGDLPEQPTVQTSESTEEVSAPAATEGEDIPSNEFDLDVVEGREETPEALISDEDLGFDLPDADVGDDDHGDTDADLDLTDSSENTEELDAAFDMNVGAEEPIDIEAANVEEETVVTLGDNDLGGDLNDLGDDDLGDIGAEDLFADEDAIETKLDLAEAYIDMGDGDGAKSMLDEVMDEGTQAQQQRAKELSEKL